MGTRVIAQEQITESTKGLELFQQAKNKIKEGKYLEAEHLYLQALNLLENNNDYHEYADALIDLSVLYHWKDSVERAFTFLLKAKDTIELKIGVNSTLYGICLGNLSAFYYSRRQIESAIGMDQKALDILEKENYDISSIAVLLGNIAMNQNILGDYGNSVNSLHRGIKYLKSSSSSSPVELARLYHDLGLTYIKMKSYSSALQYLRKGENILKVLGKETNGTLPIKIFQRIAYCNIQIGNLSNADSYLTEALRMQNRSNSYRKYLTFEFKSSLSKLQGSKSAAMTNARKAIHYSSISYKNFEQHPVVARQYTHLGEIFQDYNHLDSAVYYHHQALRQLAKSFDSQNIHSIPRAGDLFKEYGVIRSLRGKARALFLRHQESKDLRDLKASLDTYQLTHDFIKKLKEDITTMGSKQRLAGDALEIYEEAIETAIALHETTQDEQYLEKALFFAESNKAILLLESMNERMAQSVSGIPDTLLEKERLYRVDIAYYEREINEENNQKKREPNQEKIKEWDDKLYSLRREYQQLIDQFEKEYPKYYRLKYDTRLASLSDIRRDMVDRKTAFLEYFVGNRKIYLFEITKRDFKVYQMEKRQGFEEDIREIRRMARKPQLNTEEIPDFQKRIYSIYQQYAAVAIDHLPTKIQRLLIVPDDLLNLIPFELLSRSEKVPDFLISDFTIGYAYSASLNKISQQSRAVVADQLFLGYAPAFSAPIAENRSCEGEQLANLENSDREVLGIQALLGGNVMLGKDANRDSFLAQAGHYRIIHLATHACMDEENPMQSKVFFADDPIVNQDLFNLNLSADLAVLSACNTGNGQLVKGDGVLSLSKGFVHAGCPSAVMSLWSVDDFSTSEIMIDFYGYLKKGYTKDKALRKAKLDFIASADKVKKHPFFWAAFVQMGDPVALDLGRARIPWNLLIVICTLSLIGGYFIRRQSMAAA